MITALIWVGSLLGYIVPALFVYRAKYRAAYSGFLRWKNEKPEEVECRYYGEYGNIEKPRREYTWYQYKRAVMGELTPFWEGVGWPLLWLKNLNRWLHPEIAIPDMARIDELENL